MREEEEAATLRKAEEIRRAGQEQARHAKYESERAQRAKVAEAIAKEHAQAGLDWRALQAVQNRQADEWCKQASKLHPAEAAQSHEEASSSTHGAPLLPQPWEILEHARAREAEEIAQFHRQQAQAAPAGVRSLPTTTSHPEHQAPLNPVDASGWHYIGAKDAGDLVRRAN